MRTTFRARTRILLVFAGCAAVCAGLVGAAAADPFGWWATQPHGFGSHDDLAVVGRDGVARGNVLANDFGATAVVRNSPLDDPSAGTLAVHADGSYTFTPAAPGTHGTVHFTYSATDAVPLYQDALPGADKIPPLGRWRARTAAPC